MLCAFLVIGSNSPSSTSPKKNVRPIDRLIDHPTHRFCVVFGAEALLVVGRKPGPATILFLVQMKPYVFISPEIKPSAPYAALKLPLSPQLAPLRTSVLTTPKNPVVCSGKVQNEPRISAKDDAFFVGASARGHIVVVSIAHHRVSRHELCRFRSVPDVVRSEAPCPAILLSREIRVQVKSCNDRAMVDNMALDSIPSVKFYPGRRSVAERERRTVARTGDLAVPRCAAVRHASVVREPANGNVHGLIEIPAVAAGAFALAKIEILLRQVGQAVPRRVTRALAELVVYRRLECA